MLFSKSSPVQKQDFLLVFLILVGIISVLFDNAPQKNKIQESSNLFAGVTSKNSLDDMAFSSNEENLFVPGIAITLNGSSFTFNGDSPGCTSLRYVIRVFNTSTNNESIDGNSVIIDMGPDITVGPLLGGDTNSNNQIDEGEVWFYEASRSITEADKLSGEIIYQAHIEASVVGLGTLVSDDSHPSDINLDGPTVTKINCRSGINMLLSGVTKDISGNDGGCAFVQITYEVHYTSIIPGETFESIVVYGQNNSELIAPVSGDNSPFGVLDPGEIWIYTETYTPSAAEVAAGEIVVQGYVEGVTVQDASVLVSDISDPTDLNADNPTIIDFSACAPSISLIKTGQVVPGCEEILYTFTVTNQGNNLTNPLKGVNVADETFPLMVINGPQSDANNDGVMSPAEVWVFTGSYAITNADMLAGEVVNQARVTGSMDYQGTDVDVEDDSDFEDEKLDRPTVVDLSGCMPRISLIKEGLVNPDCLTIDYTFTVVNQGNTGLLLNNVVLADLNFPGLIIDGPFGDNGDDILDGSEVWTYTATYDITADDINTGKVDNQAKVTADVVNFPGISVEDNSDNDSFLEDQITTVDLSSCQTPAIQVTKQGAVNVDSDSDGCFDGITYTFTVANTGNVDLHTIVLDDDKVDNPLMMLAQPLPGEDEGDDKVLSVGEDWVFQATYSLQQADIDLGSVDNQADVSALSVGDDIPVSNSDAITTPLPANLCAPAPAIQVTKQGQANVDSDSDGCIDGITYTFTVANIGNVDLNTIALTDDKVDDPLMLAQPLPGEDEGGDEVLSVGEDWVFQATYSLQQADIDLGSVDNQADVTALSVGDNTPVNDSDNITTFLPAQLCAAAPAIQVTKQGQANVDSDSDGCIDGITYTFTVANTGNVDLHTIVLDDDKVDNPLMMLAQPLPGEDEGGDEVLSVGEDWVFQATYSLQQADIDLGSVDNQADVTALSAGDNTPVNDSDSITTFLPAQLCAAEPAIQVTKQGQANVDSDNDGCIDGITYTFTVANIGNVDLHTIVLNDDNIGNNLPGPLVGEDEGGDQVLSVGEDWVFQAAYDLQQEDIDLGSVDNQADVTALSVGDNTPVNDSDNITTFLPAQLCAAAPGIALIKTGTLVDLNTDGCTETILYSFTVVNTGNVDIGAVELVDEQLGGTIIGPSGTSDIDNDQVLSVGENWTYEAYKGISQIDIDMGSFNNQATVTGVTVGSNQEVMDFSDNNSVSENDSTNTIIPNDACTDGGPSIGLIKLGVLTDTDGDECPDGIRYIFTATNTGSINLEQLVITDDKLLETEIIGPMESSDVGEDGILSVGESWTYEAIYTITEEDTVNGTVNNQANITAITVGMGVQVFDQSDDDNLSENETTSTAIPEFFCDTDGSETDNPEFKIYTGITPNGDGVNDYFRIDNIESYPNNILKIFNRWGSLVYETENYGLSENLFRGISQGKATIAKDRTLPSGTYFYTLFFKGNNPGEESYSGYIYINRD